MNNAQCRPVIGGFTCSPCPINVTGALCELGTSENKTLQNLYKYLNRWRLYVEN